METTLEVEGVIGREAKFYGYIVGLEMERGDSPGIRRRMFARFEYGPLSSVWEVPDSDLFGLLAHHMVGNATMRHEHADYGYSKLWIEKKDGRWIADLP